MDKTSALHRRKLKKSGRERKRNGAGARKGVASRGNGREKSTAAAEKDLITIKGAAAAPKVTTKTLVRRQSPQA
jgi:hypothetical protein